MKGWVRAICAASLLGACAEGSRTDPLLPPGVAPAAPAESPPPGTQPASTVAADRGFAAAMRAPHIYMALQPDPNGTTSVIFTIDASKDDTPYDDPAIRLTPENGNCNPQELQRYNEIGARTLRPMFGPDEAFRGISAQQLPNFMAMAVTSEMLRGGLIDEPEQSQPQNVCTRKLWERMVVNESLGTDETPPPALPEPGAG